MCARTRWSTSIPTSPSSSRSTAGVFWRDGQVRLFRRDDGIAAALSDQEIWSQNAGKALGIAALVAIAARLHRDADRLAARQRRGDVPPHRGGASQALGRGGRLGPQVLRMHHVWPLRRRRDRRRRPFPWLGGILPRPMVRHAAFRRGDQRLHRRDAGRSRWRSACSPSSARTSRACAACSGRDCRRVAEVRQAEAPFSATVCYRRCA